MEHKPHKLLLLPLRQQRRHRGRRLDRVGARLRAVGGLEADVADERRDRLLGLRVAAGGRRVACFVQLEGVSRGDGVGDAVRVGW